MKKILCVCMLLLTMVLSFAACGGNGNLLSNNGGSSNGTPEHTHTFGEWETKTPATCTEAEVEVKKCECGEEETREGDAALGHNAASISAVCNKAGVMMGDSLSVTDVTVSATCSCGTTYTVTEGLVLENAKLENVGDNTVTVKLGKLSTTITVVAAKPSYVLNGTIVQDTYVSSDAKNSNYIDRETMGTNFSNYRVFLKYNLSEILANEKFTGNKETAKVQFTFTVVEGAYTDETTYTFGGFIPGEGVSDVDFSVITWNSVRPGGDYTALDWANAVYLIDQAVDSHHVSYADGVLTLTFTYAQIEDFIDENGNAIFTLRAKQSNVKISSMEGTVAPAVSVLINDEHLHAYINEVVEEKYFVSAECEKKATYYLSCSCGEAGAETFEYGEVIEHDFGEWETFTSATCTEAEVEIRKCECGEEETREGDAALGHDMESLYDATNHWTKCSRNCGEATEPVAHFGGEATETAQAICEGCHQPYGGLATHEHTFGEWETFTPVGCEKDEALIRYCGCGVSETSTGVTALGHDMQIKYDENNHWTECSRNCGEATEPVAHFGGEATETEKAVCEGCHQSYGELKEPEDASVTVSGKIVDDTYVDSGNKDKDFSTSKTELNVRTKGTTYYRSYFRFNFSDVLGADGFSDNKSDAKVQFTFAVTAGADSIADDTTFTFYAFDVDDAIKSVAFSDINWNSVASGATYEQLGFNNGKAVALVGKKTMSEADITYENGFITITVNYSDIESYMDANGNCLFGLTTSASELKVASMENTSYAIPAVSVTYTK